MLIQVIIRVSEQASITEYPSVLVQIPRGSPSVLTIASDHSTLTFAGRTSQEGRRSLTLLKRAVTLFATIFTVRGTI